MDRKFNDIHIVSREGEYCIRQVTDVMLRKRGCFIEVTYKTPSCVVTDTMCCRTIIPCMEGIKIYID